MRNINSRDRELAFIHSSRNNPEIGPSTFIVHTSLLFDPKQKNFVFDASIEVDRSTGLISRVFTRTSPLADHVPAPDVDLRGHRTVLPGFVDAHTHIFLHPYEQTPPMNQMRDESTVERIIRATNHCRSALDAGYTTYRDLGTEGLGDADISFRDAINRGLIPGPRLFVATECIASSGGYAIRQENSPDRHGRTVVPRISDVADGVDGVRAAVRRRIGAGADVIKFYADYRKRQMRFPPSSWPGAPAIEFPPEDGNPNLLLFGQDEMNALVSEAKMANCPVAAHASSPEAVIMAVKAGVDSIEHGYEDDEESLLLMKENQTIFVPTLAVLETSFTPKMLKIAQARVKRAWAIGVKLACGGDTGAFAHGENVRELELMLEAGIPLVDVLQAATTNGWEACGGQRCGRKFGWWEGGVAADIIALDGDPREDVGSLRKVDFVMKDGKVWKHKDEKA